MKRKIIFLILIVFGLMQACSGRLNPEEPKVLVYTKNGEGFVHDNIPASIKAIQKLGRENGFLVDVSDDPADFTRENLSAYQCLIFSNTNNQVFHTDEQRLALVHYIEAGGGFVGIHSACGSERNWPWFWAMLGGKFSRHPPLQEFNIRVIDNNNPATRFLGDIWKWEDECYYLDNLNPDIHVLLAADLSTVEDPEKEKYPGNIFGKLFPLAWCHEYDGGRQFYSALGHKPEYYSDQVYMKHILGGITWVLEGINELDYSRIHTNSLTFDQIDKNQ